MKSPWKRFGRTNPPLPVFDLGDFVPRVFWRQAATLGWPSPSEALAIEPSPSSPRRLQPSSPSPRTRFQERGTPTEPDPQPSPSQAPETPRKWWFFGVALCCNFLLVCIFVSERGVMGFCRCWMCELQSSVKKVEVRWHGEKSLYSKISHPNLFSAKKVYFTSEVKPQPKSKQIQWSPLFGRNFFAGFAERGEPPRDFDFESDDAWAAVDARGRPLTGSAAVAGAAKRKKGQPSVPPIAAFAGFQTRLGKNKNFEAHLKYTPKFFLALVKGHEKPKVVPFPSSDHKKHHNHHFLFCAQCPFTSNYWLLGGGDNPRHVPWNGVLHIFWGLRSYSWGVSWSLWSCAHIIYVYLEPKWPLFLKVNPPKTRPCPMRTGVIWVLGGNCHAPQPYGWQFLIMLFLQERTPQ